MNDIEIIEVEEIPAIVKRKRGKVEDVIARLDKIMSRSVKKGKVALNGMYSNGNSACSSLRSSAERYGYPIKFYVRRYELYFERLDLM